RMSRKTTSTSVRSASRTPVAGLTVPPAPVRAPGGAVAASRTPWRLFRMRNASVASEALSTVPTRESSPSRYASSSSAGCSSSTARTTRPPPLSLPPTISSPFIPVVRWPVIFTPAPRTMVTAKRRECQSRAPIGYRSEAFRHYELQTVPCPCRADLNRLGELHDKIGWVVFGSRRSCTDAQPGEKRPPSSDRHQLRVGEALRQHPPRGA